MLQLSGLADGINWRNQAINPLVEVKRATEITPNEKSKADNQKKIDALNTLVGKLNTLDSSVNDLKESSLYFARKVSVTDENQSILSAIASPKADLGSYTFDITQLATATKLNGSTDAGGKLHTADITWDGVEDGPILSDVDTLTDITAGFFTINGQRVTIATTDTFQSVLAAINTATSGDIEGNYDNATDTLTLTSVGANDVIIGSSGDTSNFLQVMKLFSKDPSASIATSKSSLGAVSLDDSIENSNLGDVASISSTGSFTINGETITFDKSNDSIRTIMNRVDSSSAGVRLYYDENSDNFYLENKNTGSLGISISDTEGGFLNAMGLVAGTTSLGVNSTFTVNGGSTITSNSNVLTESVHGIGGLSVTAKTVASDTVTIETDKGEVENKFKSFIDNYNDIISYIAENSKVTYREDANGNKKAIFGVFSGNMQISELKRDMRAKVFDSYGEDTDTYKRLTDVGIGDKSGIEGKLEFKSSSVLTNALADDAEQVSTIFTDATNGFGVAMQEMITNYNEGTTGSGYGNMGYIQVMQKGLEDKNKRLSTSIATAEKRLEAYKQQLEEKFARMEKMKMQMKSSGDALTRMATGS